MQINIKWNQGSTTVEADKEESAVWKAIGKVMQSLKYNIPNTMVVNTPVGDAVLTIKIRGYYIEDGKTLPSMYVTIENNIKLPNSTNYEEAYLTCIHPESNNYKFYWMKPMNTQCKLNVAWGRIGEGEVQEIREPYDGYLYWIRYYEKLSKGYVDQSSVYLTKNKNTKPKTKAKTKAKTTKVSNDNKAQNITEADKSLYNLLYAYAKNYVRTNLKNVNVTENQVKVAKKIYREMIDRKTVAGFNKQLLKLLQVSPRRESQIKTLLACSTNDFAGIVEREKDLISAMEAVVSDGYDSTAIKHSFASMGIEVHEANKEQCQQVLSKLSSELRPKVSKIYRVIPLKQRERFNAYIKEENITNIKQLWHGSKNCNWLSIIVNGLSLNPNAEITGKMFGNGIYFAPSSMKSWNYTSYKGTYWANGNDDIGIMGLYATAYGKPHDVDNAGSWTQAKLKTLGKNCVHAHAGYALRNDEIIYYKESAMVLNYIVVFK